MSEKNNFNLCVPPPPSLRRGLPCSQSQPSTFDAVSPFNAVDASPRRHHQSRDSSRRGRPLQPPRSVMPSSRQRLPFLLAAAALGSPRPLSTLAFQQALTVETPLVYSFPMSKLAQVGG